MPDFKTPVSPSPGAEYSVTNVITINPQFSKPKRLQEYEKAREKFENAKIELDQYQRELMHTAVDLPELPADADLGEQKKYFDALFDQKQQNQTHSKLIANVQKFLSELNDLKKAFQYDRKNSSREHGRILTPRSRKKIIERIHFLYRKWREKPHAAKFLWYTFTFTGWLDGRAYDPKNDDPIIGRQYQKCLDYLKRFYGLSNYLWVAEPQTGKRKKDNFGLPTNAIHFHAVFVQPNESFLHVQAVNWLWLSFLSEIGGRAVAMDQIRKFEFEIVETFNPRTLDALRKNDCTVLDILAERGNRERYEMYKDRMKLAGRLLYNPVDAEKIDNPKKLATYISKYVTKNSTTDDKSDGDAENLPPRPVYYAAWGCTRELSNIRTRVALSVELSDYEAELGPHVFKTHVIRKEFDGGKMIDLPTLTYEGFPPLSQLSQERKETDLPDTSREKKGFRKVYYFVRMILKETVFEIQYFKNLMGGFVEQSLKLFTEPTEKANGKNLALSPS